MHHLINVIYRVLFTTIVPYWLRLFELFEGNGVKSSDKNIFHDVIVSVSADGQVPPYAA